jgi:hypothetical protein
MAKPEETKDTVTLRTYCHSCRKEITVPIQKVIVTEAQSYPVSHAHLHGQPAHVLILYIDREFLIRGTELSETVTVERQHKTTPLSAMVLLRVPPRYKRTAMAMLKLRQASAEEIARITGKSQNVESQYLGAMFRMGYLERIRVQNFYQYHIPGSL